MASDYRPRGVYVPLVTPFTEDDRVDLGTVGALAAEVLDAGARGVIALATTGEPTSLTTEERDAVVERIGAVCADRGGELIVGAGTNDTRTTIARHAALAEAEGVGASLAGGPYYVRPSQAGVGRDFQGGAGG